LERTVKETRSKPSDSLLFLFNLMHFDETGKIGPSLYWLHTSSPLSK
jgi:hypothetical protein